VYIDPSPPLCLHTNVSFLAIPYPCPFRHCTTSEISSFLPFFPSSFLLISFQSPSPCDLRYVTASSLAQISPLPSPHFLPGSANREISCTSLPRVRLVFLFSFFSFFPFSTHARGRREFAHHVELHKERVNLPTAKGGWMDGWVGIQVGRGDHGLWEEVTSHHIMGGVRRAVCLPGSSERVLVWGSDIQLTYTTRHFPQRASLPSLGRESKGGEKEKRETQSEERVGTSVLHAAEV